MLFISQVLGLIFSLPQLTHQLKGHDNVTFRAGWKFDLICAKISHYYLYYHSTRWR